MTTTTTRLNPLPVGTGLARFLKCLILARGDYSFAADLGKKFVDTPETELTLRGYLSPMGLGDTAPFSRYGLASQLIELLRGQTVLGQIAARMRHVPIRVNVPLESVAVGAAWVVEAEPVPVSQAMYGTNIQLDATKLGVIVPLTEELAKMSGAEDELKRAVVRAIAKTLDLSLLDPTSVAISGKRPASITNGCATVTQSSPLSVETDLQSMMNALGSWVSPCWIVPSRLAGFLNYKYGAPSATPNILGYPYAASANITNQIVLADLDALLLADPFEIEIDGSGVTSLEMSDAPLPSGSPLESSTVMKSLWQNNAFAIRAIRTISWARAATDSVVTMSISY